MGAGVAGASLAYALGNEGRNVLLLERDLSEPVRIVGELLQPGGYLKLKELGLEHCVDKIDAQKVYGYAMYKDGGEALVGYPLEGRGDDVAGRSVSFFLRYSSMQYLKLGLFKFSRFFGRGSMPLDISRFQLATFALSAVISPVTTKLVSNFMPFLFTRKRIVRLPLSSIIKVA